VTNGPRRKTRTVDTLSSVTAAIDGDIGRWRSQRIKRIRAVLDTRRAAAFRQQGAGSPNPGNASLEFAIAHHRLEGAEAAARASDAEALGWYRQSRIDSFDSLRLPATGHLVPAVDPVHMETSQLSDTPYYLLGPSSTVASAELLKLTSAAVHAGSEHGFGPLISRHAPVICLLRRCALGEPMASWSTTRLPGTVFTDHVDEPLVLARDLVHEAGHNWLNAALSARNVTLPDEPHYDSPWKEQPRPPFGFLHACWAFPLTMLLAAAVLAETDGPVAPFLTGYLEKQKAMLAQTDKTHEDAVELVTDAELRSVLCSIYAKARSL